MPKGSEKILKGLDAIRKYIDPESPVSRDKCKEFIQLGMPAAQIGTTWYAHADHIDGWFFAVTKRTYKDAPRSVIDKAE